MHNNDRAEIEISYREMVEKMMALGKPAKGSRRIRICETMCLIGDRFQRQIWAWKYHEKRGEPCVETFQIGYQNESDCLMIRNLAWLGSCGYLVAFPGDKCRSYYMGMPGMTFACEPWRKWGGQFNPSMYRFWDEKTLEKKDPRLKYYVSNDPCRLLDEIDTFRRHPQSEALFKLGLGKLAMQERLYRLNPETAKELIRYISRNVDEVRKNQNLNVILGCMARNIAISRFMDNHKNRVIERDKYLEAQRVDIHFYVQYLTMARSLGYDLKDKKHLFPRDVKKAYKGILDEYDDRKRAEVNRQIASVRESLVSAEGDVMGFRFAFPKDYRDFREQSEALGNCLINNEYYKRHATGKDIIVFVFADDKRVGTAEFTTKGVLSQFTADQKLPDWRPPEKMQKAMDEWRSEIFVPLINSRTVRERA